MPRTFSCQPDKFRQPVEGRSQFTPHLETRVSTRVHAWLRVYI